MVLQCVVYRVGDGLPLTGSTDLDPNSDLKSCLKITKIISRKLDQFPDRCYVEHGNYNIYFITGMEISVLVICENSYPSVLAYCFLEEVLKEFQQSHDNNKVQSAKRPYAFIEFELFLQKAKQRFKNTRALTTKVNVSSMSSDLKARPPYKVLEDDVLVNQSNGVFRNYKDTHRPTVSPGRRFVPLNWVGMLAIVMNMFCVVLNLIRGMAIISHGHFDDDDEFAYRYGSSFMLAAAVCLYQIRLLFYVCRWRNLQTFLCLAILAWCCFFLQDFRNSTQIAFHMTSASFTTLVVLCRKLTEKLPGYSV